MTQTASSTPVGEVIDLYDPSLYINRELSWLEFNHRVLEEAMDEHAPLLERVKFLTIMSSNLDEFFMVRVAGLKRQVKSQQVLRGPDGLTAEEQLKAIAARCHAMVLAQYSTLEDELLPGLAAKGIRLLRMEKLSGEQGKWARDYFHRHVFPVLTPLALDDPSHPFPHLRNRSLNLIVTLRTEDNVRAPVHMAAVQVPSVISRLVKVPGDGSPFVLLEDLIAHHVSELFQGLTVIGCFPFRITRDSDLNFDEEEAEDLLDTIEQEVRRREWGGAVRLEVDHRCPQSALQMLLDDLEIEDQDVYSIDGPLNLVDLMALHRLPGYTGLKDKPFIPPVPQRLQGKKDLFAAIREGDILLHHPFESFNPVVDFIQQAADDPNVLAIKQTLYRTSGDSPIVAALARAAQNGKQVTALVELKARFDEANNISWARALERAGVHVVYGLVGLKTHCKVLVVVRRESGEDYLQRYVHLSTGNYHPSTARLYTDLGFLTCRLDFGRDVSRLFNLLTGYSKLPNWRKLSVAPAGLRERVLELIEGEIRHAQNGKKGRIIVQINSLVDPEVIRALYRASQAGVTVELIVRGICCLRPRIPVVSENIRVISIVGRFLEHCRICYFRNDGNEIVYLSSGDWMPRNLSRRVETMFPVDEPALKRRLMDEILALRLKDNVKARELRADGTYDRVRSKGHRRVDSQNEFMATALREHAPVPDRPLTADLLVSSKKKQENGQVTLTERFPVRATPPELPSDIAPPPDPEEPDQELHSENGAAHPKEEFEDASRL